jgi:predicted permease
VSEWRHELTQRLDPLHLTPEREAEIVEELSQHLDDRVHDLIAGGMDRVAARAAALADLDGPGALTERLAAILARPRLQLPPPGTPARGRWFQARWQDGRHAVRALRRSPAFALAVVATLALTIGPTTAMLSIGNWLLWRPTPGVAGPDRLAVVWFGEWRGERSVSPSGVSYQNLDDLRGLSRTLTGIAGVQESSISMSAASQPPITAELGMVTGNFFEVLGVPPAAGRMFRPEDDRQPAGERVAVISEGFARRAFGSAQGAVDRQVLLNGLPMTVIGVAPTSFTGTQPLGGTDVWIPGATFRYVNHAPEDRPDDRGDGIFYAFIVRLAPGATFAAAQAELDVLAPALAERYPDVNGKFQSVRAKLFERLGPPVLQRTHYRELVRMLLWIGGTLLVLGCANAANLLMMRGVRRRREHAVRLALGASRSRLILLQLTETALLALGGAGIGVALAWWLKQFMVALLFPEMPPEITIAVPIDLRVLGMTLGVSVACGLAAGLVPAIVGSVARSVGPVGALNQRSATSIRRVRSGFAVLQLALSLALLCGALLFIATLRNLNAVDLGFDPSGVTVHRLDPSRHGYTPQRILAYYQNVLDRLHGAPGLQHLSISALAPFGSNRSIRLRDPAGDERSQIQIRANAVVSSYFEVLGIRLVRGRLFTPAESMAETTEGDVVILNERLAKRLFGQSDPIGRRIARSRLGNAPVREHTVIGVVATSRWNTLTDDPELFMYLPFAGPEFGPRAAVLLVKSPAPLRDVKARVEAVTNDLDPTLPIRFSTDLQGAIDSEAIDQRLLAWVFSMLGWVALALAAVGLYGLLAQSVAERTREFGIRLAIGGAPRHVFAIVLRQAAWIGAMGTVIGLALALFGSRAIASQLFGVTRFSWSVYVSAAAALVAVVFVAGLWPARTATRIEPVEALRVE